MVIPKKTKNESDSIFECPFKENGLDCSSKNHHIYSTDQNLTFIRCSECSLIWRSPESMHLKKDYDETYFDSKNYSKKRAHKIKKSEGLIRIAQMFHPQIKSLLEVGCSVGNTLEAAQNLDIEHFGIDVSNYAVDYCTQKGLNAEKLTLDEVVERGEKFDLVFMQHVLEHFPDPIRTLNTCQQLLNKNGLMLILVPNSDYRRAHSKREKHRFYSFEGVGREHFVYFNYPSISKVLTATGFVVIQKNYPVFMDGADSFSFFLNRLIRRSLSCFNYDQEILVFARKQNQVKPQRT